MIQMLMTVCAAASPYHCKDETMVFADCGLIVDPERNADQRRLPIARLGFRTDPHLKIVEIEAVGGEGHLIQDNAEFRCEVHLGGVSGSGGCPP